MLKWNVAALSDQGIKRADNQDNFFVSDDKRVFAVADGMGGALGGATASLLTVEAIKQAWEEKKPALDNIKAIQEWLVKTIDKANETVFAQSAENPAVKGMGTTVVLAVQSENGQLHIAHVGDSRAYLIRKGKIQALTQDHSLVMELYRSGHLTEEQMRDSPFKNYITRCVGHKSQVDVDEAPRQLEAGDTIVLCTDGLTAVLNDEQIGFVVNKHKTAAAVCKELVEQTLSGGAPDNVTVIVVNYSAE
ncbi:MAG: Stp1/IreP family PP2C-type Ser/Thr phosphatase [Candidatus Obscuribacterales bacterium]|nr:Stp1/IreP family PP2C-type Ser/Thr phosphatase [Candidatus Obscuribacterales bacterium]